MIYAVLNEVAQRVQTVTGIEPVTVFESDWDELPTDYGWVQPANLPETSLGAIVVAADDSLARASAGTLRFVVEMRFAAVRVQDKAEHICNTVDHTHNTSVQQALLSTSYGNQIKLLFTQWGKDPLLPDYFAASVTAQVHLDSIVSA